MAIPFPLAGISLYQIVLQVDGRKQEGFIFHCVLFGVLIRKRLFLTKKSYVLLFEQFD